MEISSILLYEIIKEKSDPETAKSVITAIDERIKSEVKTETNDQIQRIELKLSDKIENTRVDLLDRIHKTELRMMITVVLMAALQMVAKYVFE